MAASIRKVKDLLYKYAQVNPALSKAMPQHVRCRPIISASTYCTFTGVYSPWPVMSSLSNPAIPVRCCVRRQILGRFGRTVISSCPLFVFPTGASELLHLSCCCGLFYFRHFTVTASFHVQNSAERAGLLGRRLDRQQLGQFSEGEFD